MVSLYSMRSRLAIFLSNGTLRWRQYAEKIWMWMEEEIEDSVRSRAKELVAIERKSITALVGSLTRGENVS